MKYLIHIGDSPIELEHGNLESTINVDELTTIDTGNIFGEHVTIAAAVNRIGLLKSEIQAKMSLCRLEEKIYVGKYRAERRRDAANDSGFFKIRVDNEDVRVKLTEKALETAHEIDKEYIRLRTEFIQAEKNFNALDSLYWACQDKSRKLNGLISGTTPEDFIEGLVEGKVNGILINKK
tara:strand:+ start:1291 stop:1827 length:537 start_codon:yes stop_codon:yes gene_type:complete